MNKRYLTFQLFLVLNGFLFCQAPVITIDNFYQWENRYIINRYYGSQMKNVSVADSGQYMIWDYSKISGFLPIELDTVILVDPKTTPFYYDTTTHYDRSNLCLMRDFPDKWNSKDYAYYILDSNKLDFIGEWEDSPQNEIYWYRLSDPRTELKFPIEYGAYYKDAFRGTFGDASAGIEVFEKGRYLLSADAFGTVITPSGDTVHNTLRIKVDMTFWDSSYVPYPRTWKYEHRSYSWYSKERTGPVLIIDVHNNIPITVYEYKEGKKITDVAINSKEEVVQEISLYPNPALHLLNVSIPLNGKKYDIVIYDILGRVVRSYESVTRDFIILKQNLPSGLYFFQVISEQKTLGIYKFMFLK